MNQPYFLIAERSRGEITELDRVVDRAVSSWDHSQKHPHDRDIYLDSVALNLHSFYSGLEKIFQLVARNVDGVNLDSQTWHRDLLISLSQEYESARPALISPEYAEQLDEFRRFRHLVRNIYTTNIQPEKMKHLLATLPVLWAGVKEECLAFARFLDQTS